jgi:hypothetical protein
LDELILIKFIEFIMFSLYLVFIFLAIQIWFLWKDLNKDDFKIKFINESFFNKNCIYVFSFSIFFIGPEILEGADLANAMIYFEFMKMMGFFCIVMFSYDWYSALRSSAPKKSLPYELTNFTR